MNRVQILSLDDDTDANINNTNTGQVSYQSIEKGQDSDIKYREDIQIEESQTITNGKTETKKTTNK